MFKTGFSQSTNGIVASLTQKIKTLGFFNSPYAELSKQTLEIAKTFMFALPTKWEYVTDAKTGLKILKSEKDPEALDRVRQIADELFK
jgi:hypothetical protein